MRIPTPFTPPRAPPPAWGGFGGCEYVFRLILYRISLFSNTPVQNTLTVLVDRQWQPRDGRHCFSVAFYFFCSLTYENTLLEATRERTPMGWAMTLGNLAAARMFLAEMTKNESVALMALNDFDEIVEFFREVSHSQYMELAEEQRKKAQVLVTALGA